MPTVWIRSAGIGCGLVERDVQPDNPALSRPQFRCRRLGPDDACPIADLITGQREQCLVACKYLHRRDCHVLCHCVRQLQLVREMGLAVGGEHRHRRGDHACQHGCHGHRNVLRLGVGAAAGVVDGDGVVSCELSVDDEQDATVSASAPRTAAMVRVLVGMRRSYESGWRLAGWSVAGSVGSAVSSSGGVRVDVLLGAEHEEEHHPADRRDENPADQSVDQHRRNRGRQGHSAGHQTGHQHRLDDQQPTGHQRDRSDRPRRRVGDRQPGQRWLAARGVGGEGQTRDVGDPVEQRPAERDREVAAAQADRLQLLKVFPPRVHAGVGRFAAQRVEPRQAP